MERGDSLLEAEASRGLYPVACSLDSLLAASLSRRSRAMSPMMTETAAGALFPGCRRPRDPSAMRDAAVLGLFLAPEQRLDRDLGRALQPNEQRVFRARAKLRGEARKRTMVGIALPSVVPPAGATTLHGIARKFRGTVASVLAAQPVLVGHAVVRDL